MNEYELSLWKEMYLKGWDILSNADQAQALADSSVRRLRESDDMFLAKKILSENS